MSRGLGGLLRRASERRAAVGRLASGTRPSALLTLAEPRAALVADLEAAGLVDREATREFESGLMAHVTAFLAERRGPVAAAIGVGVAEAVFGDRVYANRLDRQLAVAAAAVGCCQVEEHVLTAGAIVVRAMAAAGPGDAPCRPEGIRRRAARGAGAEADGEGSGSQGSEPELCEGEA